jgi:hypothetical protein
MARTRRQLEEQARRLNQYKGVLSRDSNNDGRLYDFWNMGLWDTAIDVNEKRESPESCWDLMDKLLDSHSATGNYFGNFAYAERTRGLGRMAGDAHGPRKEVMESQKSMYDYDQRTGNLSREKSRRGVRKDGNFQPD